MTAQQAREVVASWMRAASQEAVALWHRDPLSVAAVAVLLVENSKLGAVARRLPDLAERLVKRESRVVPSLEAVVGCLGRVLAASRNPESAQKALAREIGVQAATARFHLVRGSWSFRQASETLARIASAMLEVDLAAERRWSGSRRPFCQIGYPLDVRLLHGWDEARRRTWALYVEIHPGKATDRSRIAAVLGQRSAGLGWIDAQGDADELYRLLCGNDEALHRFLAVVEGAPGLIPRLRRFDALSRHLLIGPLGGEPQLAPIPANASAVKLADWFVVATLQSALEWTIEPAFPLEVVLGQVVEDLLRHVCGRLCASFDLFALGSLGSRQTSLGDPVALRILVRDRGRFQEQEVAMFLAFLGEVRKAAGELGQVLPEAIPPVLDYEEFKRYELEAMPSLERFQLGCAKLVWGDREAGDLVAKAAYAMPLTPERLRDLVARRKAEVDAIPTPYRYRDVVAGVGSLADLEWLVHLHEMRYPTATHAGTTTSLDVRVQGLANARLINSVERDELVEARRHLLEVRHRLRLLGLTPDIVPENPDKLARLAGSFGYADGNDFLAYHERVAGTVRSLYVESLERLRA